MKNNISILLLILVIITSCKKDEIPTSGIVKINNKTEQSQTYYVYGFLFSEAKLVTTLNNPDPDITVESDGTYLYFQTTSLYDSFYKVGDYNDEASANTAFDNLISFTVPQWEALAEKVAPNQIWIIRTEAECYAKIRIISTISDFREGHDYAECTFEWVYQPDGSLTFPGK
jgi:hypothetical protein